MLRLLAAVLLAIAGWTFNEMLQLSNEKQLWGQLPLLFWCSAWASLLVFMGTLSTQKQYWWRMALSTASAVFLTAGFPPLPLLPLAFVGFVPLLWLERDIEAHSPHRKELRIWGWSWATFFTWNILATWWVSNSALAAGAFAMIVNSTLMALTFRLYRFIRVRAGNMAGYFALICTWMSFEYFHLHWGLSWPWLHLGNTFAHVPEIVQWYEWTGAFGGCLWILCANIFIFKLLLNRKKGRKMSNLKFFGGWSVLILPVPVSLALLFFEKQALSANTAPAKEFVVIQPNYEPHYEKFSVPDKFQIERIKKLSLTQLGPNTDYLLLPETVLDGMEEHEALAYPALRELHEFLKSYPQLKTVAGLGSYFILRAGDKKGPATRCRRNVCYESHNSATQLTANSRDPLPIYIKSKLVPGAESFPFRSVMGFLAPIVDQLGGTMEGLGTQEEREVFWNEDSTFAVAPVICYESIYGEYVTEYVRKGASVIAVLTNDGWWDNTAGHIQHLDFARLRAIETRRPVLRSANTGVSCYISPLGAVEQATPYCAEAAIKCMVPQVSKRLTFYVRFGDYLAYLAVMGLVVLLGLVVKSYRR